MVFKTLSLFNHTFHEQFNFLLAITMKLW